MDTYTIEFKLSKQMLGPSGAKQSEALKEIGSGSIAIDGKQFNDTKAMEFTFYELWRQMLAVVKGDR